MACHAISFTLLGSLSHYTKPKTVYNHHPPIGNRNPKAKQPETVGCARKVSIERERERESINLVMHLFIYTYTCRYATATFTTSFFSLSLSPPN